MKYSNLKEELINEMREHCLNIVGRVRDVSSVGRLIRILSVGDIFLVAVASIKPMINVRKKSHSRMT